VPLEGAWAIGAAVDGRLPIEAVFVCDALVRDADLARRLVSSLCGDGAVALSVSDRVMRRMVDRDGPDGLAALGRMSTRSLSSVALDAHQPARVVVADGAELAGNLGTIIRCADGAGARAVLVTDRRLRVTHPLVVKASMGTVFTTAVVDADRAEALAWLRRRRFRIVAADPAGGSSYRSVAYGDRVAIVLGSEREGLAPFWRDAADVLVSIPMLGVADSLNVGHAAALLLYEALAQAAVDRS
jgi:TrmH family RNA methyltransferase